MLGNMLYDLAEAIRRWTEKKGQRGVHTGATYYVVTTVQYK